MDDFNTCIYTCTDACINVFMLVFILLFILSSSCVLFLISNKATFLLPLEETVL
ncbi:hypothetical protein MBAV_002090 [Candidatus Magnetobacterium bavaricum]|uniref:Uncharacterized protein n=1 Tax=Candidatus Magnetobacterium bavaricum TaxID=29290 RepID=A0A0F3GUZ9_9BACT|nr:hypothetical protein MBAV_002090 [Candidatus Magnetobacterium bavaricum]